MSLSTDEIEQIENSEIALVQRLWKEYKSFIESPYINSYLSALKQLQKWDEEILEKPITINDNEKEKAFDRVLRYLEVRNELLLSLNATRKLMTGEEKDEVDQVVDKKHKGKVLMSKHDNHR